jgi:hypothetical protein
MEEFDHSNFKKYQLWQYPVKVWVTTFIAAPFLMLSLSTQPNLIDYLFSIGFLEFYFIVIVMGGFLTLPGMLLLWLCSTLAIRWRMTQAESKPIFILISLLCCTSTFALFSLPDLSNFWKARNVYFMASYALPLTLSLLFYEVDYKGDSIRD